MQVLSAANRPLNRPLNYLQRGPTGAIQGTGARFCGVAPLSRSHRAIRAIGRLLPGGTEPLGWTRGQAGRGVSTAPQPGTPGSCMDKDYLVLKRASASRPSGEGNDDDFVVVADGVVVGRILKVHAAPVGSPWMWRLAFGQHEHRTPTHGVRDGGVRQGLAANWLIHHPQA